MILIILNFKAVSVMTKPGSNSRYLYPYPRLPRGSWPVIGYEDSVNNSKAIWKNVPVVYMI